MTDSRSESTARNNAIWCDTICRTHSAPGEFVDGLWLCRHPVPRIYPNMVTLTPRDGNPYALASVRALAAENLPARWAIKDSFDELALEPLGFQTLFTANWIWRAPAPVAQALPNEIEWTIVRDAETLAAWETLWSEPETSSPPLPRIFKPLLLQDPEIGFIAAYHGQQLIAGAIANRTGDVVGLTNHFAPPDNYLGFWAGCLATAQDLFPRLPIVSYYGGWELEMAQTLGFDVLDPLHVWVHVK